MSSFKNQHARTLKRTSRLDKLFAKAEAFAAANPDVDHRDIFESLNFIEEDIDRALRWMERLHDVQQNTSPSRRHKVVVTRQRIFKKINKEF